jgi:hypothetical protein
MTATKGEKGKIVREGMGGFLNPPGHPEHFYSVQTDLRRRPENRGSMSLSAAAECEWLDDFTRQQAKNKLESWEAKPLTDPEVKEWVYQVLGYFKRCYRNPDHSEPQCWYADKVVITDHPRDRGLGINDHAGVHLIRRYYPDYEPCEEDFYQAHWGKKNG